MAFRTSLAFLLAASFAASGCTERGACVVSFVRDSNFKPLSYECANDFEEKTCGAEFHPGKTCKDLGYTVEFGGNQFRRP